MEWPRWMENIVKKRDVPYTGPNEQAAHEKTVALLEDEGHLDSTPEEQSIADAQIEMIAKLQNNRTALNEYLKSIGR